MSVLMQAHTAPSCSYGVLPGRPSLAPCLARCQEGTLRLRPNQFKPYKSSIKQHRSQRCTTTALFNFARKKAPQKVVRETVVPEPSYNIPLVLAGITALSAYEGNIILAGLTGILGAFLALQASRVKFVFADDTLEVVLGEQQAETENAFVGGENKWAFSSFTNWEYWFPGFPILVYFKETQTKPEGQIHFFPIIFNGKQLYDVMVERCGSTQTSGPK